MTDLPYKEWEEKFGAFIAAIDTMAAERWSDTERETITASLIDQLQFTREADLEDKQRQTFQEVLDEIIDTVELQLMAEALIPEARILELMTELETFKGRHAENERKRIRETENRPPDEYNGKRI